MLRFQLLSQKDLGKWAHRPTQNTTIEMLNQLKWKQYSSAERTLTRTWLLPRYWKLAYCICSPHATAAKIYKTKEHSENDQTFLSSAQVALAPEPSYASQYNKCTHLPAQPTPLQEHHLHLHWSLLFPLLSPPQIHSILLLFSSHVGYSIYNSPTASHTNT